MKRSLTILVLMAYFVVSTGFVVNLHFCMDRFHSWELGASDSDRCGTCGMSSKENGCCKDEVKVVKLQHEVTQAQYAVYAFAVPAEVPAPASFYLEPPAVAEPRYEPPVHGPPLLSEQDTYLRNRVFRL